MDLVFQLLLIILSTGHTYTKSKEQSSGQCYKSCPAGFYKTGECNNPTAEIRCTQCADNTYTAQENNLTQCIGCETCKHQQVVIQECTFTNGTVCDCKEGYYKDGTDELELCKSCSRKCENCNKPEQFIDYNKKCKPCQREDCMNDSECKRKCSTAALQPPNTTSTTLLTTFLTATASTTPTRTENPLVSPINMNPMPWLIFWVIVVIIMVAFLLLLLLYTMSKCWSINKDHHSHQGSSPTSLTFHISEETPMMALSHTPVLPQLSTPATHLLPNAECEARKLNKQSEHLPAVILYEIIKEVPLRRWKEFLRLLSVADQQLERVELETGLGLGSMEKQYQMLRLWSQRSTASLNDVFSVLHYMDLSGCAQLLQENLEKLEWGRPESK